MIDSSTHPPTLVLQGRGKQADTIFTSLSCLTSPPPPLAIFLLGSIIDHYLCCGCCSVGFSLGWLPLTRSLARRCLVFLLSPDRVISSRCLPFCCLLHIYPSIHFFPSLPFPFPSSTRNLLSQLLQWHASSRLKLHSILGFSDSFFIFCLPFVCGIAPPQLHHWQYRAHTIIQLPGALANPSTFA